MVRLKVVVFGHRLGSMVPGVSVPAQGILWFRPVELQEQKF